MSDATSTSRLGRGALFAYGLPALAFGFYLFFVQFYFLKYATDVLLAAPAAMGLLFGAGRVWDAISDPLIGTWSDRTQSRFGRRRPWMWAGIPLLAMTCLLVWLTPTGLSGGALLAWCAVALFGFYTAYTVYTIPHASLGVELSKDPHQRTRAFGAQRMAFVLSMALAFGAIGFVSTSEDPRGAAIRVAGLSVAFCSAGLMAAPLRLRERAPGPDAASRGRPFEALGDVWRNHHARVVLLAWFMEGFSGGVLGVLSPYFAEYVLQRPELTALFPAFFLFSGVLAIPVWVSLSRRFGKRPVWSAGLLGSAVFFALSGVVPLDSLVLLGACMVGAGVFYSAGGAIGQSLLADTVDWDELETGERKEGAYLAAWGFALKLSLGGTLALTGVALQVAGFVPNVEQSPQVVATLRGLFSGVPVAAMVIAFLILRRSRFDAREHARVREALAARDTPS